MNYNKGYKGDFMKIKKVRLGKNNIFIATTGLGTFPETSFCIMSLGSRYQLSNDWDNSINFPISKTNDKYKAFDFISPSIIKSTANNIELLENDKNIDFPDAYKKALEISKNIEEKFNVNINVFIYKGQSFCLHRKYINEVNRRYKSIEKEMLKKKYEESVRKHFTFYKD